GPSCLGLLHRLGEAVEGPRAASGKNRILVLEIAIGRHRRGAQRIGQLAERDAVSAKDGDLFLGDVSQALAKRLNVFRRQDLWHPPLAFLSGRHGLRRLVAFYDLRYKFTM